MLNLNRAQELTLNALGSTVRRNIVQMLHEKPMSVGEIAADLPVSRPAISKHLKLLKEAHLVKGHAVGTKNVYQLDQQGFDEAKKWLDGFWDDALSRFKMVAENTVPKL